MTREQALKVVKKVIMEEEYITPDKIVITYTWDNLGMDSLGLVKVCMRLEEIGSFQISNEQVRDLHVVNDLVNLVEAYGNL